MPPKRARSARGRGRGRGGRGRGSPVATEESILPESEDEKPNVQDLSSGDELASDPLAQPDTTASAATAPPESEDVKPPLENSSAGERLSDTAAPSPTSDPAISFESSASPAVVAAINDTTSMSRGKRPIAAPRGRRRTKAERQELQKAEDDRKQAEADIRAAADVARERREGKRRDDGRGRGAVRGRGRGGYMGERETETDASGAFGAGRVEKTAPLKPSRSTAPRPSTSEGQSKTQNTAEEPFASSAKRGTRSKAVAADGKAVKQESPTDTALRRIPKDKDDDVAMQDSSLAGLGDGGYISSSENEDEKVTQRVNVEEIIDLTEDDPFLPVRVARVAHRDRDLGINAEGATDREGAITIDANDATAGSIAESVRGKQRAKEIGFIDEKAVFQATYSDSESDEQRSPVTKRDNLMPAGKHDSQMKDPPASPESRRRAKARTISNEPLTEGLDYQAQDDFEELRRYEDDRKLLRNELGSQKVVSGGDATMSNVKVGDKRAERMYLFQFPPVLPDLEPVTVKSEPQHEQSIANGDADGMEVDQKPITIPDDDTSKSKSRELPKLPAGAVGKLNVHASGRVTIDWGGTSLCLGMGTDANFLQDIVVTSLPESKDRNLQSGMATSMGRCMGKFVVTPDWDDILR